MAYIMVNGCRLYYTVQGQGTPILFIHPPVLTHFNFKYQIEELSKYFKVIAFDIRGHGRSSFSKQPLTYPLIAEDIKHLLDHLETQKAWICGYSTGGSIVLEFLLSQADRAWGGVVISGMSEVSDWFLKNKIALGLGFARLRALSVLALSTSWTNTNTKTSYWKMIREELMGNVKNVEQYYRYSLSYNCTNRLGEIEHPVLLIYGEKDKRFHRYAKLLHNKLPCSELKWIQHVKHQIPTKAAVELNDLIKQFIYTYKEPEENPTFPTIPLEEETLPEHGFYQ
ncbi:alpha/beta fold hydrolase [Ammoniphilus sp. 3BR4]|uniref:alpha/beta fold hydrolase n=1 Tax=Ammoniphilus sp. 3BR4 TaxID=3158265 RepID=UPI003465BCA8